MRHDRLYRNQDLVLISFQITCRSSFKLRLAGEWRLKPTESRSFSAAALAGTRLHCDAHTLFDDCPQKLDHLGCSMHCSLFPTETGSPWLFNARTIAHTNRFTLAVRCTHPHDQAAPRLLNVSSCRTRLSGPGLIQVIMGEVSDELTEGQ